MFHARGIKIDTHYNYKFQLQYWHTNLESIFPKLELMMQETNQVTGPHNSASKICFTVFIFFQLIFAAVKTFNSAFLG